MKSSVVLEVGVAIGFVALVAMETQRVGYLRTWYLGDVG